MPRDRVLAFGAFEVSLATYELRRDGAVLSIQKKPLDVLVYLLERHGRVVSKEELIRAVWPGMNVSCHALTSALRDLRRALGGSGAPESRIVTTVRGRGYQFVPQVTCREVERGSKASARNEGALGEEAWRDLRSSLEEAARDPSTFRLLQSLFETLSHARSQRVTD
jgi:DNA-binding winged helix-turn-helix (wHTH) protein